MSEQDRAIVKRDLNSIINRVNCYLDGSDLDKIQDVITRLGRGNTLPHWFDNLKVNGTLPNADGKTVGSIIEMLLCADLEINSLRSSDLIPLKINPAKGVDIPGLDVGIKSPSENWCTSEPFTSAYGRLLGSDYDVICIITNYQTAKKVTPLRLKIINHSYFKSTEIADKNLCLKAQKLREVISDVGEANAKKGLRFLAHVIQSDWLGKSLASLYSVINSEEKVCAEIKSICADGQKKMSKGAQNISEEDVRLLNDLVEKKPIKEALINLSDTWVNENSPELAVIPNSYYWNKFLNSPLDGKLGVSFALQWRYNFGVSFREGQSGN